MLFPHEQIEQDIKAHQNEIKLLKEKKKDLTKELLLYDICTLWKEQPGDHLGTYSFYADLNLSKEDTLLSIHNFLDEVEETILIGWAFDLDQTNGSTSLQSYYYTKEQMEINIDFSNNHCKEEPTGRMIPEVRTVCSLER